MLNVLIVLNLLIAPTLPAGLATVTLLTCAAALMVWPMADWIEAVIG